MTEPEPIVFVIDDEPSVRKSLGRLLKASGYRVEVFASAQEFLERGWEDEIGCVVLDVQMPDLNGLELQQTLAKTDRSLSIVFITGYGDIPMSVQAMKAGAIDFLSKPFDEKDLLEAVDRALEKVGLESGERAAAREAKKRLSKLTPREHEVLLHVLAGRLNKQIAATLGASEKTIKVHRGRVMRKMQVQSVADLVRLCERAGIRLP
jgi:FixJ family two-component response regulator